MSKKETYLIYSDKAICPQCKYKLMKKPELVKHAEITEDYYEYVDYWITCPGCSARICLFEYREL